MEPAGVSAADHTTVEEDYSASEPLLNSESNVRTYDTGTFLPDLTTVFRQLEENQAKSNEPQSTAFRSMKEMARTAKENSSGFPSFLKAFYLEMYWAITCNSIVTRTFVIIPMGLIVVGGLYWNDCPAEPYIPIYLVAAGSAAILSFILFGTHAELYNRDAERSRVRQTPKCLVATELIVLTFQLSWFFAGCWWIYSIYQPLYNPPGNYCGMFVYHFAFWTNNVVWILSGMCGLLVGSLGICYLRIKENIAPTTNVIVY